MIAALRHPAFLTACAVALIVNLALWAFLAYLEPSFSGAAAAARAFVCS